MTTSEACPQNGHWIVTEVSTCSFNQSSLQTRAKSILRLDPTWANVGLALGKKRGKKIPSFDWPAGVV
jgi:hypothetical protein